MHTEKNYQYIKLIFLIFVRVWVLETESTYLAAIKMKSKKIERGHIAEKKQ
jgi:hypothetical protein